MNSSSITFGMQGIFPQTPPTTNRGELWGYLKRLSLWDNFAFSVSSRFFIYRAGSFYRRSAWSTLSNVSRRDYPLLHRYNIQP